ncbi:MAG TPA: hypothetical protein VMM37_00170 [Bacteroidota bacterium]|nr:hypothetical protein [Bacteroidota bacterium]
MKKYIILCMLAVSSTLAFAQQRPFGIGALIGTPSGISATFSRSPDRFVDVLLAWDIEQNTIFQGHYNFRFMSLEKGRDQETILYGGPGVFFRTVNLEERTDFGFSGNFGIGWTLKQNLEIYAEISPKVGLVRLSPLTMTGGLGFRYLF